MSAAMLNPRTPTTLALVARLGQSRRYAGSIHDDASARAFGYARALVPGAFLYGYMSRLAIEAWGKPWLERGTMQSWSRRPVYDGEQLTITATPIEETAEAISVEMTVHNADGQEVATGAASLPHHRPQSLDLSAFPITEQANPPPTVAAGALQPDTPIGSIEAIFTPEEHQQSLSDFGETWPPYLGEGIVHAGYLMRRTVGDGVRSFAYPTPGIYVSAHGQHHAIAHAGDLLVSAGRITRTYERKGSHYFDSEQVVIANGAVLIAHYKRSSIYAVRPRVP
jgi:hypothetical protein